MPGSGQRGIVERDRGAQAGAEPAAALAPQAGSLEVRLLRRVLLKAGNPPIEFVLAWSGERVGPTGSPAVHRVRIKDRATLRHLLRDTQVRFGDAYSRGLIEVDGDLVGFLAAIYRHTNRPDESPPRSGTLAAWLKRPRRNTLAGSRDNIHRHYDLGNEFYALWLGQTMAYTCAYYPTSAASLDEAQIAKMDHVCRKLRLTAADTVVEAGCGWGEFALHAAERFGARVRAFNISREQLAFARRRAKERGLEGRVEFIEDDYRNIEGTYDVFASIGMLEHVGLEHYPELGRVVNRVLSAQGRGLIHSIGRNRPGPLHPWIERRIFPGAYPPSLGEMTRIFEPWSLSVLDVENLRLHYARTLRDWLSRFEAAADHVRALYSEEFVRMWRLYLAGSVAAFETGVMQLFQVLFTRQDNNDLPLTREHLYRV